MTPTRERPPRKAAVPSNTGFLQCSRPNNDCLAIDALVRKMSWIGRARIEALYDESRELHDYTGEPGRKADALVDEAADRGWPLSHCDARRIADAEESSR
jgi:hypothetical protein